MLHPTVGLRALCVSVIVAAVGAAGVAEDDPYQAYVLTSKDFQPVNQDKDWCYDAFASWTYMPWTYQWTIGYDDASGNWSLEHGYNGAFLDEGRIFVGGQYKLGWINKFGRHFYMDHTASKGYLHPWDGSSGVPYDLLHGNGVRVKPVNDEMKATSTTTGR